MTDLRLQLIMQKTGYKNQSMIMIEEMAELTQAISKERREKDPVNYLKILQNLKEEIVDVQIMLNQMKFFLGMNDSEIKEMTDKKLNRQIERMQYCNQSCEYADLLTKEDPRD